MGDVVSLAARKDKPASEAGPRFRPERQGYLLVPARILETLARLEASVDAYAADHGNTGKHIDWNAYYGVVACLEMATRYR
jgi:hypothetical protein